MVRRALSSCAPNNILYCNMPVESKVMSIKHIILNSAGYVKHHHYSIQSCATIPLIVCYIALKFHAPLLVNMLFFKRLGAYQTILIER